MIIGIDIDDTISKTNEMLIKTALWFDEKHVKGKGFKNKNAYSFMDMFYWSVLDVDNFMKYIRNSKFFSEVEPIDDAAKYIGMLKNEGNKIILITKRTNSLKVKLTTIKWLKKNGFKYDKLILGAKNKGEICDLEGVSFFVDNDIKNILDVSDYGIKAVLMGDNYNKGTDDCLRVETWQEVYNLSKEVLNNGENS